MKHKTIHQLPTVAAVGMALSLLITGNAEAYTFTKIADTTTPVPNTNSFFDSFGAFDINNSGTVAFSASVPPFYSATGVFTSNKPATGVFTSDGEQLTTISFREDTIIREVNINDKGDVAFWRVVGSPRNPVTWDLLISSNGLTTLIYRDLITLSLGELSINNEGTVAFLDRDVLCCQSRNDFLLTISADGEQTTIAHTSPPLAYLYSPAINDIGTVAFTANLDAGGWAIFTSSGGDYTTIVDTSGSFQSLFSSAINNAGTVAFGATLDAGGQGIFTSSGRDYTTIVNSSGLFDYFSAPALNNAGTVAFWASLDAGGYGIFTGSDPITDKVITTGDTLFGSTVTGLRFSPKGINDAGQIAFIATFGDGSKGGLFRADPEAQLPTSVPEPGSIVGLGLLGLSTFLMRKRALS